MPAINFYEGVSEIIVFYFPDNAEKTEPQTFIFPYTYVDSLFKGSFSKDTFYKSILGMALESSFGVKVKPRTSSSAMEYYATGLVSAPDVNFSQLDAKNAAPNVKKISFLDSLKPNILAVYPYAIAVESTLISFYVLNKSSDELNFIANMDIYGNLAVTDSRDVVRKYSAIRNLLSASKINFSNSEYYFTGDVFTTQHPSMAQTYLLIFDILYGQGVFSVRLDSSNLLAGLAPLQAQIAPPKLCTLANFAGKVEILIENDVGGRQLLNLDPDRIFVVPLDEADEARVLIKHQGNVTEKTITGGSLGLVVDTRDKIQKRGEYKEVYVNMLKENIKNF